MNSPIWTTLRTLVLACILLGATALPVSDSSDEPQAFRPVHGRPPTPGKGYLVHFEPDSQPVRPAPIYAAGRPIPHRQETLPAVPAPHAARPGPRYQQTLPAPPSPRREWWHAHQGQRPERQPYVLAPGQHWAAWMGHTAKPPEGPFIPPDEFLNPPSPPAETPTNGYDAGDEAGKGRRRPANAAPGYGSDSDGSSVFVGNSGKTLQHGLRKAPLPKGGAPRGALPKQSGPLNKSGPLAKVPPKKGKAPQGGTTPALKKTIPLNRPSGKGKILRGVGSSKKVTLLAKGPAKQSARPQPAGTLKRPVPAPKLSKSQKPGIGAPKKAIPNARASKPQNKSPTALRKRIALVKKGAKKT